MSSLKDWAKILGVFVIAFFYPVASWFFPTSGISHYVLVYAILAPLAAMVLSYDLPDGLRPKAKKTAAKIISAALLVLFVIASFLAVHEIWALFSVFFSERPGVSPIFITFSNLESIYSVSTLVRCIYYLALTSFLLGSLCWLVFTWRDRISAVPFLIAGVMSGTYRCVYYLAIVNFEETGGALWGLPGECVRDGALYSAVGLLCAVLWHFVYKSFINRKLRNQNA